MANVRVQAEDFDAGEEGAALARGRGDVGAVVTFVGYCRDEGAELAALDIEYFPGMAEAEIARAADEAQARWPLLGATIVHRFGRIRPGEPIVLVATAAAHRGDAFASAEMLMDYLKSRAPFWKRPIGVDGTPRDWVEARDADHVAAAQWSAAERRSR
jgi:molybdopterin synthase catalytic subunit